MYGFVWKVGNFLMSDERLQTAIVRVKKARHPERPYMLDYVERTFDGFVEFQGDRRFADDLAIICGFADYHGTKVAVLGQQKGRDTNQRRLRNFGMPKPEGYRKAMRFMNLADKFGRPIISFIDTPGAYPGIDAEERGQAEAIARNLLDMEKLNVPIIAIVIGEGGSGGALGIAVADVVLMLENSIYSVISPEGCAAILWKDAAQSHFAAAGLKLTAHELLQLNVIDEIVDEPEGGAHTNFDEAARKLDAKLWKRLQAISVEIAHERLSRRYRKLRTLGSQ